MKTIKVKTQKSLSALIGLGLALAILLQAGNIQSTEKASTKVSVAEAEILSNIEAMLLEEEAPFIEEIAFEDFESKVKVFNSANELVGEGDIDNNRELRTLVNKADLIGNFGDKKYFRITE